MNKKLAKLLAVMLVLAMAVTLFAGCSKKPATSESTSVAASSSESAVEAEPTASDTLVVGYSNFSGKFSPFFATTQYDMDAQNMTQLALLGTDREGNVVQKGIEGETRAYNGTDYTYTGIADVEVVQNDDGTADYKLTMRDDIKFSDGTPMTIDDVIFSMYVLSDPTYDGSSTFYAQPIKGMEEYRAGMSTLSSLLAAAGEDNTDFSKWTEDEQKAFWAAVNDGGVKFAQEIVKYCVDNGAAADENDVATAASAWGYDGLAADATAKDFFLAIGDNYGWNFSNMEKESAGSALSDLIPEDVYNYSTKGVVTGEGAASIEGIERTGDYSLTLHMTKFDATTIYNIGVTVAPLAYYGDKAKYDYANNSFGFAKGDLSTVRAKTGAPMGAGAYKFVSYENGVVTFEANDTYYKGAPKIKNILFKETADGDKLSGLVQGTFDITDPSFSADVVDAVKGYNSNGELTGDVVTTNMVDNLGYGYIGINASLVKVGDDSASDQSKDLRKAIATLYSVYRNTVVDSYYGELASVVNYPISNTSWAAPRVSDDGYQIAYSVDVDGKPIYTDSMTDDERYAAALAAAVGYLKAAGYTFDDASGKFTAAPAGASLTYSVIIPGDGQGNHPSYGILTNAKEALASIGLTLEINDPSDSNQLWTALDANTAEMWCAAWQATPDPDMYQVYHSDNVTGSGTNSNHYYIQDADLDSLIMEARTSADQSFRKATYKECLDIILDWAVEIPVYQRKNAVIFSTERVNIDTLTPDITTFWGWMNDLETLEMK